MWETICNKNTVQDGHGKQQKQQERQGTREDRGARGPPVGKGVIRQRTR